MVKKCLIMKAKFGLVFSSLFIYFLTFSQSETSKFDFNNYKCLISKGEIPEDFTVEAYNKINKDIQNKKLKIGWTYKTSFLKNVHYEINELLHSGQVVYGDEVSLLMGEIADKLLKDKPEIRKELRFYTLKSNEVNAFSTFQGIIFVTTGLISRLDNESQLAFILSHEIIHYTQNHLVDSYNYSIKNQYNSERIKALSNFSKKHEFEADSLGVSLYNKAGYPKSTISSVFDVLLYSELPFENSELSNHYFDRFNVEIPNSYFSKVKFEIKVDENGDDFNSTHPNIKKRKDAIKRQIISYNDWKDSIFISGQEKFELIRNICRFEAIRTFSIEQEFDDVIYNVYLLEKDFPESLFLHQMEAKAWLGISHLKLKNNFIEKIPSEKDLQGEIGNLQFMLKKLSPIQIYTISLKIVEHNNKLYPNDNFINFIRKKMISTLVKSDFDIEKFYKTNKINPPILKNDDIATEKYSDFDKINSQLKNMTKINNDSLGFHYFMINDIILDSNFVLDFRQEKKEFEKKIISNNFDLLSERQKRKLQRKDVLDNLKMGIDSLLINEPLVYSYSNDYYKEMESEYMAQKLNASIHELAVLLPIVVKTISYTSIKTVGTDGHNQKSILNEYVLENPDFDVDFVPTDFQLFNEVKQQIVFDKIMFLCFEHDIKIENIENTNMIKKMFSLLIFPISLPIKLYKAQTTRLHLVIIDLNNFNTLDRKTYEFKEPFYKYTMMNRMFEILKEINTYPSAQ